MRFAVYYVFTLTTDYIFSILSIRDNVLKIYSKIVFYHSKAANVCTSSHTNLFLQL